LTGSAAINFIVMQLDSPNLYYLTVLIKMNTTSQSH
jgi:hypothetical protein